MTPKKLYRSSTDKVIAGVCGGLGKYLEVDSTLIRVIFLFLILMGGSGLLLYIILAIVIPRDPSTPTQNTTSSDTSNMTSNKAEISHRQNYGWGTLIGLLLLFLGVLTLSKSLFPMYVIFPPMNIFWPVVLVAIGLFMVIKRS